MDRREGPPSPVTVELVSVRHDPDLRSRIRRGRRTFWSIFRLTNGLTPTRDSDPPRIVESPQSRGRVESSFTDSEDCGGSLVVHLV